MSFFEMNVALAFRYFSYSKIDLAIIEVGLGGRLDATNIIEPELSIKRVTIVSLNSFVCSNRNTSSALLVITLSTNAKRLFLPSPAYECQVF